MCGINGIISNLKSDSVESDLSIMNDLIFHRGPDDGGTFFERNENFSIGLGMRRLSIIDLNSGIQPFFSDDNKIILIFNGEIYNYLSIKNSLIHSGVVFKTNSDTEVLLKMYEKDGVSAFSKLDGMFAFSIYDKRINKIFIVRDYFGEKPIYYFKDQSQFTWSSELKSLVTRFRVKPKININALGIYFQLTYIPAPFTIYENVFKLEANHYIEYDCKTFEYNFCEIPRKINIYDYKNKLEATQIVKNLVYESVNSRAISDVPIGTFLSGGVDSSIVSLCLANNSNKKIDTFSVGFTNKNFDESDKAKIVAKIIGSDHHQFMLSEMDFTKNIDEVILNFDEPFADSSALASFVLAEKTSKHVKVSLTGDGGDEVFGGYNKYYFGKLNKKYTSVFSQNSHNTIKKYINAIISNQNDNRGLKFKISRFLNSVSYENDYYYNIISLGFQSYETNNLFKDHYYSSDVLKNWKSKIHGNSLSDYRTIDKYLSLEGDMLVKIDRTSMLASLECRSPFLNKKIWDFCNQIPESYLINKWDKKHILKEAFKENFPKNFLHKSKSGFGVPVGDWLKSNLRKELILYTDKNFIDKQNIFNYDFINSIVKNHLDSRIDNTFRIWTFYCFQKWYKNIYEA
jgi:asparagine synthase (glutamine-hydrolysing)